MKEIFDISWTIRHSTYIGNEKISKTHLAEVIKSEGPDGFTEFRTLCGRKVVLYTRRGLWNSCWVYKAEKDRIKKFGLDNDSYFTEDECIICGNKGRKIG